MIRKQLYRLFLERERSPFFGTDYRDLMLSQCFFGSFVCILHSAIPNTDNRLLSSKSEATPHETLYQTLYQTMNLIRCYSREPDL